MHQLVAPDPQGYKRWAECLREFDGGSIDGSGFNNPAEVADLSAASFARYLSSRTALADTSIPAPAGFVHCTFYWIVDESAELLGFVALRHELNQFLFERGGHIGYSVRPRARNKGVAGAALNLALLEAQSRGIERTLVCAKETNLASRRVIERAGGVYESSMHGVRRYWFDTAAAHIDS
ncbi:GNAT family N-acetyltransferase [Corynebacterium callunae]|uniref:GNAT family N-acetyltransferase n=1 Tax=Corynebacterium callunae TaxID=1721 RepID=UPI0039825628